MTLDAERLTLRLADLEQALEALERYVNTPPEAYAGRPEVVGNARYQVIVATEAAVGVAQHVVVRRRLGVPQQHGQAFELLREAGLLAADLVDTLRRLVGLRNLLVHRYGDVDDTRVRRELGRALADLRRFAGFVRQMIAGANA